MLTLKFVLWSLAVTLTNQECIIRGRKRYCQDININGWSPTWVESGFPQSPRPFLTVRGAHYSFINPRGVPDPVPRLDCHYPCIHQPGESEPYPYASGEIGNLETGSVSWKFGGWMSQRMGKLTLNDVSICQSTYCEEPIVQNPGQGVFFDKEWTNVTPLDLSKWMKSVLRASRIGYSVCYGSTVTDTRLFRQSSGSWYCLYPMWNGYDGKSECHLTKSYQISDLAGSWDARHIIAIPEYGWSYTRTTRNDQCVWGYDGGPYNMTGVEGACHYITRGGTRCVVPTPLDSKKFHLSALKHHNVEMFASWHRVTRNERGPASFWMKLGNFANDWDNWGPMTLGHRDGHTCTSSSGAGFDTCQWLQSVDIKPGVRCDSDVPLSHGHIGLISCRLNCNQAVTYTTCTNLLSHTVPSNLRPGTYGAFRVGNGVILKADFGWAIVNGNRNWTCQAITMGAMFCMVPPGVKIKSLCAYTDACVEVNLESDGGIVKVGGLTITPNGVYSPDHTVPLSRKPREATLPMTLRPKGDVMEACVFGLTNPISCTLYNTMHSYTWQCRGETCCHGISPLSFGSQDHVTLSCGPASRTFLWNYATPLLGNMTFDWMWRELTQLPWWALFLVSALCAFTIKMVLQIFYLAHLTRVISFLARVAFIIFWDMPGFLRRTGRSYFWALFHHRECPNCHTDMGSYTHLPDGTCPHEGDSCPWCPCKKPTFTHYLDCHLQEHVNLAWGLAPWNWIKFWKLKFGVMQQEVRVAPLPRVFKPAKYVTLALVLVMSIPTSHGIAEIVATQTCADPGCEFDTQITQIGLWPGDKTCYRIITTTGPMRFCASVISSGFTLVAPVIKCRADTQVIQFSHIYCAHPKGGCYWYDDSLDKYSGCPLFWDDEILDDGGPEWGCAIRNMNSACRKAVLYDNGGFTHCLISPSHGTLQNRPHVCFEWQGKTTCTVSNHIQIGTTTITFHVENPARTQLPDSLMIKADGSVYEAVNPENGCFARSKEKVLGSGCNTGLYPPLGCRWTVYHWWDSRIECEETDIMLCNSIFAFPPFHQADCNITEVHINNDSNSFLLQGEGCSDGPYKISMSLNGKVVSAPVISPVRSISILNCTGVSGVASAARCDLLADCGSATGGCELTAPVRTHISCGVVNPVYFTSTDVQKTVFDCEGHTATATVHLEIASADAFAGPHWDGTTKTPSPWPWYYWLLITFAVFTAMVVVITIGCLVSNARRYQIMKQR